MIVHLGSLFNPLNLSLLNTPICKVGVVTPNA